MVVKLVPVVKAAPRALDRDSDRLVEDLLEALPRQRRALHVADRADVVHHALPVHLLERLLARHD